MPIIPFEVHVNGHDTPIGGSLIVEISSHHNPLVSCIYTYPPNTDVDVAIALFSDMLTSLDVLSIAQTQVTRTDGGDGCNTVTKYVYELSSDETVEEWCDFILTCKAVERVTESGVCSVYYNNTDTPIKHISGFLWRHIDAMQRWDGIETQCEFPSNDELQLAKRRAPTPEDLYSLELDVNMTLGTCGVTDIRCNGTLIVLPDTSPAMQLFFSYSWVCKHDRVRITRAIERFVYNHNPALSVTESGAEEEDPNAETRTFVFAPQDQPHRSPWAMMRDALDTTYSPPLDTAYTLTVSHHTAVFTEVYPLLIHLIDHYGGLAIDGN